MDKDFYVSPFIDMEGQYTVHVQDDPASLRIAINERQGDAPVIATSLVLDAPAPDATGSVLRHAAPPPAHRPSGPWR